MSPVQRLKYRYRRWQYKREMAMPVPPPRRPQNRRYQRAIRRARHPIAYTRNWMFERSEAQPVPEPTTYEQRRGGPIRRTYRRVRIKLSDWRHSFTDWPITGQIVVVLAAAALVTVGFFGVKKIIPHSQSENLKAALASVQDFQQSVPTKKAGQIRVLVSGDSTVINLGYASDIIYSSSDLEGLLESAFGCDITNVSAVAHGKTRAYPDACKGWPGLYHENAHFFVPDVSVLMIGQGESLPHRVNGKTLRPGQAEYANFLMQRLDVAREAVGGNKTPLVIVTPICDHFTDGRLNVAVGDIENVFLQYARTHPGVSVVNLARFTCPRGQHANLAGGKPMFTKTGAFTKEGGAAIWNFIDEAAHRAKNA